MVKFTPEAVARLNTALEPSESVRIAVVGGGCAGMSYVLDIVSEGDEEDLILQLEAATVYVDPHSADILSNTTIDYETNFLQQGFIFLNPDANTTCGCGSSFS